MRCSNQGLGPVLQQNEEKGWKPISYASRFLTELESKYSINELELLAVMWLIESFQNYVYVTEFGVVSDHKALQSVSNSNKGNKIISRWVNRLMPFDFAVIHRPERKLGMANYLSRHPSQYEELSIKTEETFNDWFTINVVKEVAPKLHKAEFAKMDKPIRSQKNKAREIEAINENLIVHASAHKFNESKQVDKSQQASSMASESITPKPKKNKVYIQANYEADKSFNK